MSLNKYIQIFQLYPFLDFILMTEKTRSTLPIQHFFSVFRTIFQLIQLDHQFFVLYDIELSLQFIVHKAQPCVNSCSNGFAANADLSRSIILFILQKLTGDPQIAAKLHEPLYVKSSINPQNLYI